MEKCEDRKNSVTCGCGECGDVVAVDQAEIETAGQGAPRAERAYIPAVDVIDNEAEVVLYSDLPGVDEKGIDVTLEKNVLTIKAKPAPVDLGDHKMLYAEYGVGDYQRSFALSEEVDRDGITASIKDGVLTVRIPKSKPVSKKITVANV